MPNNTRVHVTNINGQWVIVQEDDDRSARTFATKLEALNEGRDLARRTCSELVVHGADGRIQGAYTFAAKPTTEHIDAYTPSRLAAVTIENFKGIGESVTVPMRPVTLLFGANSAGKSTIIQALQYFWEVLENRNADVDRTRLGGDVIDLGGFRNLVHGHDESRRIAITVHLADAPETAPYCPPGNYFSPAFGNDWRDGSDINASSHLDIECLSVQVVTAWNYDTGTAEIVEYGVELNNESFARVGFRDTGDVQLSVNVWHPLLSRETRERTNEFGRILADVMYFFAGEDVHEPDEERTVYSENLTRDEMVELASLNLELPPFQKQRWPLLKQQGVVPHWGQQLSIHEPQYPEASGNEGELEEMSSVLSQLIVGAGEAVLKELRGMRYVGPLRVVPGREHHAPLHPGNERWANGLGAWDTIQRDDRPLGTGGPSLVERCSYYLHEVLGLDYTLRREERIQLPVDSTIYSELKLIANQFEEREAGDMFRVLAAMEALPRNFVVQLHDEKNDIDVQPMDIGVGVSQSLPVVVGAVDPRCTVFAVEQPELHVHPAVQSQMGDLFLRECLPSQPGPVFLLETHSEHLILRMLRRVRETSAGTLPPGFPEVRPEDIQVVHVESKGERTAITPLEITPDGDFFEDWPHGFFTEREEDLL